VTSTKSEAAAAVRIGAGLALRKRDELLGLLRPCFARTEPWLQAGKYVSALVSELPRVNGWSVARHGRDRTPDRAQRLLNHASWDTSAAMSVVRRFAATGLEEAARRRAGMVVGAIDETGQEKAGEATAGVKRQYMGCAGRVANGINTVHLSYVRDKTGHALIGARQWIPREHIDDPVKSLLMGLPLDLGFRTKGQLAIDICTAAYADGIGFDFACGDEVYGNCTQLREFFETRGQAYVLRVPSNFTLTLAAGTKMTCAQAVKALLKDKRRWEIRSAGHGSKGQRWYAWAWIATASPRHHLLVRRHLKTGDLAFHYCWVPGTQVLTKARLIRAAGLRWPIEEDFEFSKDCFGLGQCQARLYTAIARHTVLVMAALAICAITAALVKDRTDTQAPPPVRADQPPPADPGMIPLTIPEIKRLLAALTTRPLPRWLVIHWDAWTRRHQARSRWFHKRTRLARDAEPSLLSQRNAAALLGCRGIGGERRIGKLLLGALPYTPAPWHGRNHQRDHPQAHDHHELVGELPVSRRKHVHRQVEDGGVSANDNLQRHRQLCRVSGSRWSLPEQVLGAECRGKCQQRCGGGGRDIEWMGAAPPPHREQRTEDREFGAGRADIDPERILGGRQPCRMDAHPHPGPAPGSDRGVIVRHDLEQLGELADGSTHSKRLRYEQQRDSAGHSTRELPAAAG